MSVKGPPAPFPEWIGVALRAVDPVAAVQRAAAASLADWHDERLFVVGVGKAVRGMLTGLSQARPQSELVGVCIDKAGVPSEQPWPTGVAMLQGDHPIPGLRSFESSQRLVDAIDSWPADAAVVVLLSGGASALLCLPDPTDREALIELTRRDLGLPIAELNRRRAVLDPIKAGGLAKRLAPRRFRAFVVDDVPTAADPLATIGSGPTVTAETRSSHTIVASNRAATTAVIEAIRGSGHPAVEGRIGGVASEAGERLARTLLEAAARSPAPVALVAGGESSVKVRGTGLGGRNQELALGAARALAGHDATLVAIGTDGEDGPTDAAGAWVDGTTAKTAGPRLARALANNDAYPLLAELGCLICTGRTGTNVADLVIGIANANTPSSRWPR